MHTSLATLTQLPVDCVLPHKGLLRITQMRARTCLWAWQCRSSPTPHSNVTIWNFWKLKNQNPNNFLKICFHLLKKFQRNRKQSTRQHFKEKNKLLILRFLILTKISWSITHNVKQQALEWDSDANAGQGVLSVSELSTAMCLGTETLAWR